MRFAYSDVRLHIDGRWRDAADGAVLKVTDPATGRNLGVVARAGQSDLDLALAAASRGFEEWRHTSSFDRGKVLRRAAVLLRDRVETIARLLTMENGKPIAQARLEILSAADMIDWFAEEGRRVYGRVIPARRIGVQQVSIREPIGPVAAFTPWNFPIGQAAKKLGAALSTGCSVILKAAEETPGSASELVRAFADAGLPDGALNLVFGLPSEISEYLIPHPVIRKVSFTGSTVVGKHLAALAGLHMKRATMELGGHSPVLVFADADIDGAASQIASAKYRNAGQVCIAPTRLLIHHDVYARFLDRFVAEAEAIKVGNGLDEATTMGPLIHERRREALEGLIHDAVERGGQIAYGGGRVGNEGHFLQPTVMTDVPREAAVMQTEVFGPIALISRFRTQQEAISGANSLSYGLAAYVYTRSAKIIAEASAEMEAGMISINHNGLALAETPFGGVKDSGYGSEGGSEGIDPYVNTKFVSHVGV